MRSPSSLKAFVSLLVGSLVMSAVAVATVPTYIFNRSDIPLNPSGTPLAVGAGDFNGDHITDLVFADQTEQKVYVLLGKSDGTFPAFSSAVVSAAPAGMVALAVGDFNKDGKLDVVTLSQPSINTVSIMLGNGKGGFAAPVTVFTGNGPKAVIAADFNNDAKLDLAVVEENGNTVTILLGDGKGNFKPAGDFPIGATSTVLATGDFNGDGKPDLVVGSSGMISVLLGNGDGTFQARKDTSVTTGAAISIGAGNFNPDGNLDVAVQYSSTVYVLLGNGDGTFQTPVANSVCGNSNGGMVVTELNAGGQVDIAVTCTTAMSVLLGNGDGTFQKHLDYDLSINAFNMTTLDANGDGRPDLAITGGTNNGTPVGANVLINTGVAANPFGSRVDYTTGSVPEGAAIGDLRSNGKLDLVVANSGGTANSISVLLGNGDGTFGAKQDFTTCTAPWNVVIGKFHGDTNPPDVVVSCRNATGGISLLAGNGNGTFKTHKDFSAGAESFRLATGDFNKDGNLDIAVANNTANTVSILLGDGAGNFTLKGNVAFTSPAGLVAADFNKDGILDLAVTGGNSTTLFLGNGDGTFTSKTTLSFGGGSLGAYDVNHDGNLDLVVAGSRVFLGNGDGTFGSAITTGLPSGSGLAALDLNQDGKLDLAVANDSSAYITGLGNGDGTFQTGQTYLTGSASIDVQAADLNGDGQEDLAIVNQNANSVTVYLATGVPAISPVSIVFPTQLLFTNSKAKTVTVSNPGAATLDIGKITFSVTDFITLTDKCSGAKVPAGGACTFSVSFDPQAINTRTGTANFTANGINESVGLSGVGTEVKLSPTKLNFGSVKLGTSVTMPETLTNVGSTTLNIKSIKISGTAASDYQITSNGCGSSVPANTSCTLDVTFTPSVVGTRSAKMSFTDDGGGSPQSVGLTGSGT